MPADLPTAIGEVVRELREARGMSGWELSRLSGLAMDLARQIERMPGKRGPSLTTLAAIAGALGLRGSELLALAEARVASERKAA